MDLLKCLFWLTEEGGKAFFRHPWPNFKKKKKVNWRMSWHVECVRRFEGTEWRLQVNIFLKMTTEKSPVARHCSSFVLLRVAPPVKHCFTCLIIDLHGPLMATIQQHKGYFPLSMADLTAKDELGSSMSLTWTPNVRSSRKW